MRISGFRYALCSCAAAAILAGCGGQAAGAPPQSASSAQVRHVSSGSTLLYASAYPNDSYVLSYPGLNVVATIPQKAIGDCSGTSGNVYLIYNLSVYVYAHGATTPGQSLTLPAQGLSCAVDPSSGNLAVTLQTENDVAVFTEPYDQPTLYSVPNLPFYCGYDNAGNLFVDYYTGFPYPHVGLSQMPAGGNAFSTLTLSPVSYDSPGAIQWDGEYLTVSTGLGELRPAKATIDRVTISDSTATVVSTTTLTTKKSSGYPLIYQNQVIMPYVLHHLRQRTLGVWSYPQGGKRQTQTKNIGSKETVVSSLAISVAAPR